MYWTVFCVERNDISKVVHFLCTWLHTIHDVINIERNNPCTYSPAELRHHRRKKNVKIEETNEIKTTKLNRKTKQNVHIYLYTSKSNTNTRQHHNYTKTLTNTQILTFRRAKGSIVGLQ